VLFLLALARNALAEKPSLQSSLMIQDRILERQHDGSMEVRHDGSTLLRHEFHRSDPSVPVNALSAAEAVASLSAPAPPAPAQLNASSSREVPFAEVHALNRVGEPAHHASEDGHDAAHSHDGYKTLLLFFVTLFVCVCFLVLLERYCPALPYTAFVFVLGFLVTVWHKNATGGAGDWKSFMRSLELWESINPHLLLYAFLPPLLFAEVMKINVQLVKSCFWQCFTIACPGVILGTGLAGTLAKYCLPYDWDWPICLTLGAMLSATDPVAVVALFNTLGVSPRLTMLVSGESLLNDGAAIVVFNLTLKAALNVNMDGSFMVEFLLRMLVVSPIVGALIGYLSVAIIAKCSSEKYHHDAIIQVIITIACAYLSFFLAESEFRGSGVLGVITAGFVLACYAWPLYASMEVIHTVWETIEVIGNTMIFFLAGVLFSATIFDKWGTIGGADFGWLLLLYFLLTLARSTVLGVLYLPLNQMGQEISTSEAVAMVWSGLRGAVSLALAIMVDEEQGISKKMGARIMFHAGGMAALSLLVNATTAGPLLFKLGLAKNDDARQARIDKLKDYLVAQAKKERDELLSKSEYQGVDQETLTVMMPMLKPHEPKTNDLVGTDAADAYRETFLQAVKTTYWHAIEEGIVPRRSKPARILLNSVDEGLNYTKETLKDWECLSTHFANPSRCVAFLVRYKMKPEAQQCYSALTFLIAHEHARKELPTLFPAGKAIEEMVDNESKEECAQAEKVLAAIPADVVTHVKTEMLARKLITSNMSEVHSLQHKGIVSPSDAAKLEHGLHHALINIMSKVMSDYNTSSESAASPAPAASAASPAPAASPASPAPAAGVETATSSKPAESPATAEAEKK